MAPHGLFGARWRSHLISGDNPFQRDSVFFL